MANVFDPLHQRAPGPASPDDSSWRNWLTTALLVFFGISLGGVVLAVLHPRPQQAVAVPQAEKEEREGGGEQPRPAAASEAEEPAATPTALPSPVVAETNAARRVERKPQPPPKVEAEPKPTARPRPASPPKPLKAVGKPAAEPASKPATKAEPQAVEAEPAPPEDAAKRAAYIKAVADARLAMWRRDLAAAHKSLKTAQKNSQSPADETQSERLGIMLDHLDQFWNALRDEVAKLRSGDELELKDNRVAVVEASRSELMIHVYGRQQRYRIEALPIALIRAVVDRSFSPTPGSKVIVGTFLAMDKEGDRGRARALWEEAAKQGESLGHDLLPELDVPLPNVGGGAGAEVHRFGGR